MSNSVMSKKIKHKEGEREKNKFLELKAEYSNI